jgi:hypothetical protein
MAAAGAAAAGAVLAVVARCCHGQPLPPACAVQTLDQPDRHLPQLLQWPWLLQLDMCPSSGTFGTGLPYMAGPPV